MSQVDTNATDIVDNVTGEQTEGQTNGDAQAQAAAEQRAACVVLLEQLEDARGQAHSLKLQAQAANAQAKKVQEQAQAVLAAAAGVSFSNKDTVLVPSGASMNGPTVLSALHGQLSDKSINERCMARWLERQSADFDG